MLALVLALGLASCGIDVEAVTAGGQLTRFEGQWQCDVQSLSFESVEAIDAELDVRLAGQGLTREQYDAFKKVVEKLPEVRTGIRESYEVSCG